MGYDQESRHASRGKNPARVAGFVQPEQLTNEMACLLCRDFFEKSLPGNAGRQAFACRARAFQV